MTNYLHRILHFIAASRNADLKLHLQDGEELSKIFFALDRIKYKRLWPRYISDMHALKSSHPDTWRELEAGNVSDTKNTIPFVSVGADHAVEHLNRSLKVHAGVISIYRISNNANARQRFLWQQQKCPGCPVSSRGSLEYKTMKSENSMAFLRVS